MKRIVTSSLSLSLGVLVACASAQEVQWRPAGARPATPAATGGSAPWSSTPAAALGKPEPLDSASLAVPTPPALLDRNIVPIGFSAEAPPANYPVARGQNADVARPLPPGTAPAVPAPATPFLAGTITPGHSVTTYAPGSVPVAGTEAYNNGVVTQDPAGPCCGPDCGAGIIGCGDCCGPRGMFQSDHCFDYFISPITNPFFFEDPRSLTEFRPIFIHQVTPDKNYAFKGGDIDFFGFQGRVALSERWSIVIPKMGWIWTNPKGGVPDFDSHVGITEFWIGPKFTFLRNENTGSVAAIGMNFQIPAGPGKVFQDTGNLSLTPYISYAQNFGKSSYGSWNFMNTTGVSVGVDNQRSDFFFSSFHLDFDVANLHKIYPLIELNWLSYVSAGKVRANDFEGGDLINFGSAGTAGSNSLTMAAGVRYKFCEAAQIGIAAEFPLVKQHQLNDFRLTVDFIWRY